jgi:16S rRNA (guanine966-N2)-methyltransferase
MSRQRESSPPGQVRIVGGRWRGTRLPVPDAEGFRPSADRVRETLFNWLQPVLPGARVLDLFAGSGALGLESLSRGAREAVLVENDPMLAKQLHASIERLGAEAEARVVRADAIAWLQVPLFGQFDVVFLDPPFGAGLWKPALARLSPWLSPEAWLYLEAPVDQRVDAGGNWIEHRQGHTRQVRYTLLRRVGGGAATLAADSRADGTATE